jgi:hypothetical protein
MEPRQIVRTSDRGTFKRCRQLWDFTSKIRQDLEPVQRIDALDFGTAIHAGLQAYYDPETWTDQLQMEQNALREFGKSMQDVELTIAEYGTVEADEKYRELRLLGHGMLGHYFLWAPNHDDGLMPVMVEQEFEVELYEDVVYQGRVDLVMEDRNGYWIVDHKTASVLGGTEWLALDDQCSSYAWALRKQLGLEVRGVIYNELRKKVPVQPKVLKDGSLSTDKRQDTTHDIFLEAIISNGLDIEDYGGHLAFMTAYPKEFFRRTQVTFTLEMLDIAGERIRLEAVEMLEKPSIYPTPSRFNCTGCAFLAPCIALHEGRDYTTILKENYTRRNGNG